MMKTNKVQMSHDTSNTCALGPFNSQSVVYLSVNSVFYFIFQILTKKKSYMDVED